MKQIQSLRNSESGVIHHLGLFILGAVVLAGIGFAVFTVVQKNSDSQTITTTIDESAEEQPASDDEYDKEAAVIDQEAEAIEEVTQESL